MNLNKVVFNFKFNWAALLAGATFWSYGFFGALTAENFGTVSNIVISLALCGLLILLMRLWQTNDAYKDNIVIKGKDILVFASFFIIMLVVSFGTLTLPLNGDQLAHAQQSKLHSITLIDWVSSKTDFFNNVSFKYLIYIIDVLIIAAGFFVYKFTKKRSWLFKIVVFSLLFLVFRFTILAFGGSAGPHPTFRLFPLWLSSAIFMSSDFSFRLAQFIGLIGFMWLAQRIANQKLHFLHSWLFALAVGTIPVLWHVGTLVEFSIWTAIAWALLLLYLFSSRGTDNENNYVRWISIIALATALRQSAFVAFIPLLLIIAVNMFRKKEFNAKKMALLTIPILLIVPFLLNSVIVGTPVNYQGDTPSFQRVWMAFDSGIAVNAIMNSVGFPWIVFLVAPLFFIRKNKRNIVATLIFFIAGIYIFYMITPEVWGLGRYQAEYVVPFIILGFFLFINHLVRYYDILHKILPAFFVCLIVYNAYIFENIASMNKPVDELKTTLNIDIKIRGAYAILSEFPYKYDQAFTEAKHAGYAGKTFVAGITYGVFSEVLNNYTVGEARREKNIYEEMQHGISAETINKNKKIELILISDFMEHPALKSDLKHLGWKPWKEFKNTTYGSTIFGLVRENAI